MFVVAWDFKTVHVLGSSVVGAQLGLVDHADKLLVSLGNSLKTFPTRLIEQLVVLGIDGARDRVISCNHR